MEHNNSLKILVAEDEYLILMGLTSSLKRLGYQIVAEATDGQQAIELSLEKKPDIIIIDINMPLIDGLEAVKRINEKTFIPSIIVTGYNNKALIQKAADLGVFGYLIKPVDEKDLKPAIEIAMAKFKEFQRLQQELKKTAESLETRKYVERAKGILMDQLNLKEGEAMKLLQQKSRDSNKKIAVIAQEIIKASEILSIKAKK
ncbi:MAG TPA: response regulator [Firmicutes bacterium]|jgi:response regulator NasT|nr:response regulator [Bacillota bacterium]